MFIGPTLHVHETRLLVPKLTTEGEALPTVQRVLGVIVVVVEGKEVPLAFPQEGVAGVVDLVALQVVEKIMPPLIF